MPQYVTYPQGDPQRRLRALTTAVVEGARDGVKETTLLIWRQARQNVTDLEKVDRGILRNSLDTEFVESPGRLGGITFVGADYGVWVEFGRAGVRANPTTSQYAAKAAFPPVEAIAGWVRRQYRKLAPSGVTKSGRARKPQDADVKQAAFLIARKIYWYGIKPAPFLVPAFTMLRGALPARIRANIARRLASLRGTA